MRSLTGNRPILPYWLSFLACLAIPAQADDGAPFKVRLVAPPVIAPEKCGTKSYSRHSVVLPTDFTGSEKPSLILNGAEVLPALLKPTVQGTPPSDADNHTIFFDRDSTHIQFWIPESDYSGRISVQVGVNSRLSEPYSIVVSEVDRWVVAILAAVATIIIFGFPVILVGRISAAYTINGHRCNLWTLLFLDQETDTYSLAKFQFLLWTLVSLFAYAFLTLAKSLAQGMVIFPDIPGNLPGVIAISAGTGVLAPAASAVRGAKGAGQIYPGWADFITSGGVVAADRFQFFVWTLTGTLTFLFLVLSTDPRTVQDLPSIPPGFLQLMGLSSLGYLAGKVARGPGPIIDQISPLTAAALPGLTLTIVGRKLSQAAGFKIDDIDLDLGKHQAQISTAAADVDDNSTSPSFYKKIKLQINAPDPKWVVRNAHDLILINPDGQSAEWPFTI